MHTRALPTMHLHAHTHNQRIHTQVFWRAKSISQRQRSSRQAAGRRASQVIIDFVAVASVLQIAGPLPAAHPRDQQATWRLPITHALLVAARVAELAHAGRLPRAEVEAGPAPVGCDGRVQPFGQRPTLRARMHPALCSGMSVSLSVPSQPTY